MRNPSFPLIQFRSKELSSQPAHRSSGDSSFQAHPLTDVVRSVFVSSLMWGFLAITVYTVYSMIAH
ncbi:MAG: hypothetical protein M3Y50_01975 [Acidobacteriota bacterium]|nr:hypothetical protein [Acidobacteriota bacterium]